MEDFAIAEAPEIDSSPSTGVDTTEVVDSTSVDTQDSTAEGDHPATPVDTEPQGRFAAIVDGKLAPAAKQAIDKIKADNPQAARAIERALFAEARFYKELPNGFKDLQQLRQTVETLGGDSGIQEMQGELGEWRKFDSQYTAGDASVLKFLTETPEASEAFLQIAPAAFQKFRELNQEGHDAYVAQIFQATLAASKFPLIVDRLEDLLPADNPRAAELLNKLRAISASIDEHASKSVTKPMTKRDASPNADAQKFEQEKQAFEREKWQSASSQEHTSIFREAWTRLVGNRQLTPGQQSAIRRVYPAILQEQLGKKKDFNPTLNSYFQKGQKDGFIKFYSQVHREAVPMALKLAMAELGIGKPGPKPGVQNPNPAPRVPTGKPSAPSGYTPVSAKPNFETVDKSMTDAKMWSAKKAVLKGGKRVSWT